MINPRNQPLAVLITGIFALVVIAQFDRLEIVSITLGFPVVSILLGISLAVVQVRSEFTLRRSISRDEDPLFFLFGLVLTTAPLIIGGLLVLLV